MISNDASFESIYRAYYRRVYSFLYKLCHEHETAEDLTQETFYQAYKSLSKYRGECEMFTWLASIAKNMYLKYLRHMRQANIVIDLYVTEPEAPMSDEPGYRIVREIDIQRVRQAIAAMPSKYSEVLILRIYGELPFSEIAMKLGISVNSAKVIYYRAKKMIKEILLND